MVLSVVALLIQLLPALLQSLGVVSPAIEQLIQQLASALPGLISSISSGQGATADIQAVLAAFQTEIQALKTSTSLDPHALAIANTLDGALQAALAAYTAAEVKDDPSTLTPLPTNV